MIVAIIYYVCSLTLGVVLSGCVLALCQMLPKSGNRKLFIVSCLVLLLSSLPFFVDIVHGIGSSIAIREGMSLLLPIPSTHFASQLLCVGCFYMLALLLGIPTLRKGCEVKFTRIYVMFFLLESVWFTASIYICLPDLLTM